MARYPRAKQLLIPPGANDPRIKARVGVLHVDAVDAESLYRYFNGQSGGIESHFHIPKASSNPIEQYRDTDYEADANYKANPFAISVETQGLAGGTWSNYQLDEIKLLMLWAKEEHDIPLQEVGKWDGEGWGYHTLFGAPGPWTPVNKSCPGPLRKEQFHDILVPWMKEQGEEMDAETRGRFTVLEEQNKKILQKLENNRKAEARRHKKLMDAIASEKA